jgi:hypothetical protein
MVRYENATCAGESWRLREFQKGPGSGKSVPAAAIRLACQQRNIDSLDRSPMGTDLA